MNVTIPVLNEQRRLANALPRIVSRIQLWGGFDWEIHIVDNGSTDQTLAIARRFERDHAGVVRALHLPQAGRGRAIKHSWSSSGADLLCYMDVDLSTDLDCLPDLLAPLQRGAADISVGSRLLRSEWTVRSRKRECLSRVYNRLIHLTFDVPFSDAQCGFKAMTRSAAERMLPCVGDNGWFFDTELLVLASRFGLKISDIPIRWAEDPDSRVEIMSTVCENLRLTARLWWKLRTKALPNGHSARHRNDRCSVHEGET